MKYLIYIILFILFIVFKHLIPVNLVQTLFMGFYAVIVYFITDDFNRIKTAYRAGKKTKELAHYYKMTVLQLMKDYNAPDKDVRNVKKLLKDIE